MFRHPPSRWVTLFVASGFAFLLADVGHSHHYVLKSHTWAWAPLAFAPLGLVVFGLAGLVWRPGLLRLAGVVSVAAILVGSVGIVFHNAERFGGRAEPRARRRTVAARGPAFAGMGTGGARPHWSP